MKLGIFIIAIMFGFSMPAMAETKTRTMISCGSSEGYSYYVEGKSVTSDKAGWNAELRPAGLPEDSIINGKIYLVLDDASLEYDIQFANAAGIEIISTLEEGGKIYDIDTAETSIIFFVSYDGKAIETYMFNFKEPLEVVYTQIKYGNDILDKVSVWRAACTWVGG